MKKRLMLETPRIFVSKRRIQEKKKKRNSKEGDPKEDGDVGNADEWLRREGKVTTEDPRAVWAAGEYHSLHNSF